MPRKSSGKRRRLVRLRIRNYFFAGILVSAPVIVTGWLVIKVLNFFDHIVRGWVPDSWMFDSYLPFAFPGIGLFFIFISLVIIGFVTASLVGAMAIGFFERMLARVPIVSNVYKTIKQILDTVLASRSSSFRKVVLLEYPRKNLWAVAFMVKEAPIHVSGKLGKETVSVFLPTTPNPTSGFFLIVPVDDVIELDITVEEGIKLVMSSGIVAPETQSEKTL